ncbi:MAG: hypothetical protein GW861_15110 [Deltaproteobacteria bacterium]|nr:hypothetical protein [Deltaproteobacteria bacterium]
MDPSEQSRFNDLFQRHLRLLKLQGKSDKTIDVYARAVRRVASQFQSDHNRSLCAPDGSH